MDPWHPDMDTRAPRDQGEHPVVSKPTPNVDKMQFMLTYFIAARRGGRSADCGSSSSRSELAQAASDLYDRAERICKQGV